MGVVVGVAGQPPPPDSLLEVKATGDEIKRAVAFNKTTDFSGKLLETFGMMQVHNSTTYITKVATG